MHRVTRRRLVAGVTAGLAAVALAAAPAATASPSAPAAPAGPGLPSDLTGGPDAPAYDARADLAPAAREAAADRRVELQAAPAVQALATALGDQGVVDMDPATGTPRQVARLDGTLTGPSATSAVAVARGWLNAHSDVVGLTAAEVGGLVVGRDYVDVAGTHHVSFVQRAGGMTLFGNGVRADVTARGELLQVTGSPVRGLTVPPAAKAVAVGSAEAAIRVARADTREADTAPGPRDSATRVLFQTPGGTRTAWRTVTMSARTPTLDVVDAGSGRLLYRSGLASDAEPSPAAGAAALRSANVVTNALGAAKGGTLQKIDLSTPGWLPAGATTLTGNNAHAYADLDDDNRAGTGEEVAPKGTAGYRFPLTTVLPTGVPCATTWPCTWDPGVGGSWRANLPRTTTQAFYLANVFHDHLAAAPIGFTEAAGNFQTTNTSGTGQGGDAVLVEALDGANGPGGLPDSRHVDNANFATPPDGQAPRMQMYLFHQPGATADPFVAGTGSDDASVVYHEYTHGLSNRLVVDATGSSTLRTQQSWSMGEGWSDFYAVDFLVDQRLVPDTAAPGEVVLGRYLGAGATQPLRTEPVDCPVGATSTACPGTATAGAGGYTYGDFGRIAADAGGVPYAEVHADGEIWAQTLWDVRAALGSDVTESLVTRAMELSPAGPSMLDMRNAVLAADTAVYGGAHRKVLWARFAARGMGFFAGTTGGDDLQPHEDFSPPPTSSTPRATLSGSVTESVSGARVAGARVAVGGLETGKPGVTAVTTTKADGTFTLPKLPVGTYSDVYATGAGYDPSPGTSVTLPAGGAAVAFFVVRDWASSAGGAGVTAFTGPDRTAVGCGPGRLIDQTSRFGWASSSDLAGGTATAATPKQVTIRLPRPVDLSGAALDPSPVCGDGWSAGLAEWRLETSTDGTSFTPLTSGAFDYSGLYRGRRTVYAGSPVTGVVAVRLVALTNQLLLYGYGTRCPDYAGCTALDAAEVAVHGRASGA